MVADIDLAILPSAAERRMPYLLVPLLEEVSVGQHLAGNLAPLPEELRAWVSVVATSADACLVLDSDARVVAISPAAAMLAAIEAIEAIGQRLVGDVLAPVDFSSAAEPLDVDSVSVPPVAAARHGVSCHGLLRLRRPDGSTITLDTVSTPLHGADGQRLGSLTFFAQVAAH